MKKDSLKTPMTAVLTHPDSTVSEAFKTLRTNIEFSGTDKSLRSILVTSSFAQEGKTSIVLNLGAVFAQMDKKVLIIDADLRNPSLHVYFGLDNSKGLSSVLTSSDMDLNNIPIVAAKDVNNLYILPSGPIPKNPSELLISINMKKLNKYIKEKFDLIIFDSPPILLVTDAAILSREVDALLLVARSGKTTIPSLQRSKTILDNIKANIIGIVINDIEQKENRYYYHGNKE